MAGGCFRVIITLDCARGGGRLLRYALLLFFDKKTEKKIGSLVNKLEKGVPNSCAFDSSFPAHITLLMFEKENARGLKKAFDEFVSSVRRGGVTFASIGVFNPRVLFLSPVVSEYLTKAQSAAHAAFSRDEGIVFDERYMPNQWVPHASLGVDLEPEDLLNAFGTVQKHYRPFSGRITRVALTRCCPEKELYCEKLKREHILKHKGEES